MTRAKKDTMITVRELAKRLRVHTATLFFWIARGLILPGRRMGRYRVWTDSEAEAIIGRVTAVRGRLQRHSPVCTVHGNTVVWACPFCRFQSSRPAPVRSHMRGCGKIWDADEYRGSEPAKASSSSNDRAVSVATRSELRTLFESVLVGSFGLEEFTVRAKAHLRQAEALQVELQRLLSEEG